MIKTRFFFLSLLSVLVLLSTFIHTVGASDLGTIKNPTPMVTAEIINCTLEEGWCSKEPYVRITGDDPAYAILAIEGSTNGKDFYYDGKTCSILLNNGFNNLIFWSVSSSGRISDKKYLKINLTANMSRSLTVLNLTEKALTSSSPGKQLRAIFSFSSSPVIHSPIDENASLSTKEEESARQINIDQLILLLKGSVSTLPLDADEKNNSLADATIQPTVEKPVVLAKEEIAKNTSRISVGIFNYILQRNIFRQNINSNLPNKGEEYNLVLDNLPPNLSLLTQQSISGNLTFEGYAYDGVSGIESLMVNLGRGWLPVTLENNHWTYQWNTEKAGISSGVFNMQVRVTDSAGNEKIQTQRFMVINRIWPVLSLCALFLSLGFTSVVDPRRKAWRALAHITARAVWLDAIHSPKENR